MRTVLLVTSDTGSTAYTQTRAAFEAIGCAVIGSLDNPTDLDTAWSSQPIDLIAAVWVTYSSSSMTPGMAWVVNKWSAGTPIMLGGIESGMSAGYNAAYSVTDMANKVGIFAQQGTTEINSFMRVAAPSHPVMVGAPDPVQFGPTQFGSTPAISHGWNSGDVSAGTTLGWTDNTTDGQSPMSAVDTGDALFASTYRPSPTAPARAIFCGWLYGGQSDYTSGEKYVLTRAVTWLTADPSTSYAYGLTSSSSLTAAPSLKQYLHGAANIWNNSRLNVQPDPPPMVIVERCWPNYSVESGTIDTTGMYNNLDGLLTAITSGDIFDATSCYSQYWFRGQYTSSLKKIIDVQWRVRAQGHGAIAIHDRASYGSEIGMSDAWAPVGTITVDSDTLVDYHIPASSILFDPAVWDFYGVDGQFSCTSGDVQIDTAAALLIFSTDGKTHTWSGDLPGGMVQRESLTIDAQVCNVQYAGGSSSSGNAYPSGSGYPELNQEMANAASGTTFTPTTSAPIGGGQYGSGNARAGASPQYPGWYFSASVSYWDPYLVIDPNAPFVNSGVASWDSTLVWGQDYITDPNYFVYERNDKDSGSLLGNASADPFTVTLTPTSFTAWDIDPTAQNVTDDSWSIGTDQVDAIPTGFVGNLQGTIIASGSGVNSAPASVQLPLSGDAGTHAIYLRTAMMRAAGQITVNNASGVTGYQSGTNQIALNYPPSIPSTTVRSGPYTAYAPMMVTSSTGTAGAAVLSAGSSLVADAVAGADVQARTVLGLQSQLSAYATVASPVPNKPVEEVPPAQQQRSGSGYVPWGSDVRISMPRPLAGQPQASVSMQGFIFTVDGLRHDLTQDDWEKLMVPDYGPADPRIIVRGDADL